MSFGETFNIGGTVASVSNPTVTNVTSVSGNEGTSLVHTVTLSAATTASTDYTYSLSGGTATAGVDYTVPPTFSAGVTLSGGTLTVPSGVSVFNVTVAAISDGASESSETYNLTIGGITGVGTISDAGSGVISITASRTSGPAPLAVHFEANGSNFKDAHAWDFDDTGAGTWSISGRTKETETDGAIVAHVFDTPGTYDVTVGGQTVAITVTDPDTVFSGTNTICVSPTANYTGAPSGSQNQTSLPSSYAGKRVLLHRGESFGSISPLNTDSGFQVGAYGTGADPIVTSVGTGMVSGVSSWTNDWTIMDIDAGNVSISATTYRFLMYRCTADTVNGVSIVDIGSAVGYYYANVSGAETIPWPREIFLVDNTLTGVVNATNEPAVVLMGSFLKSGIMGNSINLATEHTTRIWSASKTFIGHNDLGGVHYDGGAPPGIRHAFKMHSGGVQDYGTIFSDSPTPATSKVVIAYNHLGDAAYNGSWISQVSPQNTLETEGIEDVLIVGNAFERGPYTSSDMQLRGRRMTWRGNTVVGGGSVNIARSGSTYPSGLDTWDGPYTAE